MNLPADIDAEEVAKKIEDSLRVADEILDRLGKDWWNSKDNAVLGLALMWLAATNSRDVPEEVATDTLRHMLRVIHESTSAAAAEAV